MAQSSRPDEEWQPMRVEDVIGGAQLHAGPVINPAYNLAIFVTRDEQSVRWGAIKQIQDIEWNLYVLHWNSGAVNLLFINGSDKDFHEEKSRKLSAEARTASPVRQSSVRSAIFGVSL